MGNHEGMRQWNDIVVLTPEGDIDIASAPSLRRRIDACCRDGVRRIIVNCQRVTFIDSTGLSLLLSRARWLALHEGMLSLVGASADIVRILQIARLIDVLHVSPADRPAIPSIGDAAPLWSKTFRALPGVEHLAEYRHRIAELLESLPLTREERFDMALAGGEALSNAYDHAKAHTIACSIRAYADRVVLEVTDDGTGFDMRPDDAPVPTLERGRGIRLMRMLVDLVDIERRRMPSGTVVRLTKLTHQDAA